MLSSVVDSGATVPVMHPEDAADYELLESQASRAGVEYEVANLETIPNLGEKKFAILTAEGTLRGYQTQCAETAKGKPLQAVPWWHRGTQCVSVWARTTTSTSS